MKSQILKLLQTITTVKILLQYTRSSGNHMEFLYTHSYKIPKRIYFTRCFSSDFPKCLIRST